MARERAKKKAGGGRGSFMDSYVKVNDRIALFRGEFPEGFIHTESTEVGEGVVEFKALVFRTKDEVSTFSGSPNGIASATGHSRTYVDENDPEKCLEKGETVAVGRALAMLGFEVQKSIASEEEVEVAKERSSNKKTSRRNKKEEVEEENTEEEESSEEENTEEGESNIEDVPEDGEEEETATKKPRARRGGSKASTKASGKGKRKLKRRR